MALSAATIWETRAAGASDNYGGGFNVTATGTDYSQSNTPILSVADAVTNGTTTVTSTTGGFTAAMIGNNINLVGDGIYQITARASSNSITVDRNTGTSAAQTANVGGALATLTKLAANMVASNKAYSVGAFSSSATITFAQTVTSATSVTPATRLIGYGSSRGDASHATLAMQTNANLNGITTSGQAFWIEQVDVDSGSLTNSISFLLGGQKDQIIHCKAANFTTVGIDLNALLQTAFACEVTGGTSAAAAAIDLPQGSVLLCAGNYVHDNACPGIVVLNNSVIQRNLVVNNSGASSDGILYGANTQVIGNTCHNNGRDGIRSNVTTYTGIFIVNNLLTSNGGYGITGSISVGPAIPASAYTDGNAFYNNTSGTRNLMDSTTGILGVNPYTNTRDIILTGLPYVGPTTGSTANFGLNGIVGAGAACKGHAVPSAWPGNTGTTGYLDMGAVQSKAGGLIRNPSLEGLGN